MSLNLSGIGRPLAKIVGGKYNNMMVSVSDSIAEEPETDNKALIKEFKRLKLSKDSHFQHVPDTTRERDILYLTGASGSGKSYSTRKYLEEYKKKYKNNEIYLFSALPEDSSIDPLKPKRIKIDESLYEDPIPIEEFANSCVIMDDVDCLSDRKIKEAVYAIMNKILEIGRHYSTTCIVTNHLPTDGRATRRILNEAQTVTYFPHSAGNKIRYLLENYVGVDKKQISRFKRMNTRSVLIFKNFPQVYMTNHEIGLLNDDDIQDI
jgi:hypothetical protein